MEQIIIATKNRGKAEEFKSFFSKHNMKALSLLELDNPVKDIEETGSTFEENAALKAEQMANLMQTPVLADDSGLIIDALNGEPGVFSARYAGESKNDQANIEKVLRKLGSVPIDQRNARFICVLAIGRPDEETIFKTGYCEGTIALSERGENGFGYDPIFIPDGFTLTMAELTFEEKNEISHRKKAINQLEKWIQKH